MSTVPELKALKLLMPLYSGSSITSGYHWGHTVIERAPLRKESLAKLCLPAKKIRANYYSNVRLRAGQSLYPPTFHANSSIAKTAGATLRKKA